MPVFFLVLKEISHRKFNFLLSLAAVALTVALFICFFTVGQASKRETIRVMRDMGFNLRIIPKQTDMEKFWLEGYSDFTLPQESVNKFTLDPKLSFNHLVATLHKKITWRDGEIFLTGIASEVAPPGKGAGKSPMIFSISPGSAYIGSETARKFNISENDEIEIMGKTFKVVKCLPETGSIDDLRVYASLSDVQEIFNMEGRINEIKALECLCRDPNDNDPDLIKKQLQGLIPDAKALQIKNIAIAREKQRQMVDRYFAFIMPIILAVSAVWIGSFAMLNVRDREPEIGIFRALGFNSGRIASLFLSRAVIIGIIGAFLGFIIGTWFALSYGAGIFKITAKAIQPMYNLLGWAVIAAPLFAALSSAIPTMLAVLQDPAVTLRKE